MPQQHLSYQKWGVFFIERREKNGPEGFLDGEMFPLWLWQKSDLPTGSNSGTGSPAVDLTG